MTAFFHASGATAIGLTPAQAARVAASASITDGVPSTGSVWSSFKVSGELDLLEAGVAYKTACLTTTAAALPTCTYVPGLPGTLTADTDGVIGALNGIALIDGDRLLVRHEAEARRHGVYTLVDGDGTNPWVLTRSEDMDGSPSSECAGGSVVSITEPAPAMFVLTGSGYLLVTDATLGSNDELIWTDFVTALIPTDLECDTLAAGCGGTHGYVALIDGSNATTIGLDAEMGSIVAATITTPGLTAMAASVAPWQPI
jgi:hypothetical protein